VGEAAGSFYLELSFYFAQLFTFHLSWCFSKTQSFECATWRISFAHRYSRFSSHTFHSAFYAFMNYLSDGLHISEYLDCDRLMRTLVKCRRSWLLSICFVYWWKSLLKLVSVSMLWKERDLLCLPWL
jgi:hypothetical protein